MNFLTNMFRSLAMIFSGQSDAKTIDTYGIKQKREGVYELIFRAEEKKKELGEKWCAHKSNSPVNKRRANDRV